MRLVKPEYIAPVVAYGAAAALAAGCGSGIPTAHNTHNTYNRVANPNFVPRLQALGKTFLLLYRRSSTDDRSTPFEVNGQITVGEVDIHVGMQVLKLTVNQLPSTSINPDRITSLDILRFSQPQPSDGFDMSLERNADGTLDASCASYRKPQGFSESHQSSLYDHDGSPLPNSSPELARGFLSDMLTTAAQQLSIAGHDVPIPSLPPEASIGDPCGVNFG